MVGSESFCVVEVGMLKPETVQILKRDGYTDKQITALDYLVRCAEMGAKYDTKMKSLLGSSIPVSGMDLLPTYRHEIRQ